jgi:hypothetical protein
VCQPDGAGNAEMAGNRKFRECMGNGAGLLGSTNDEDIPTKHTTSANNEDQAVPSNINQGTLIRSHAKKLQQQVI